ncbi:D-lactaldehyde dehydrogenase [Gymnopus androsaceus JB14]|uniref:D-lactaldehyde dehydrogenase n=1 Tax=Gymnopus androsaceus JB14 TaxID=1447944 RepID=A0A6A4GYM2_9AGAR|nr:D-lactaldehyde dehydrogenase [Gymnopus androsaceus JB14]
MPTVPLGSKVLVTGINGYIAAWVGKTLLEKGYSVRGTVRSEDKAVVIKQIFAEAGYGEEKFETVVVEDITKDGVFDEAVKGVDAIEHTASPFHLKADDPQELINPAVNGTLSILKSALRVSGSIRRIVVTSSTAAVVNPSQLPEPKLFSEVDWNNQAIEEVKKHGREANQVTKYRASKTLAEKAAWEFYNSNKANISWDLVTLNPPFVFGPAIHLPSTASPSALGTSLLDWYNTVATSDMGGKSLDALANVGAGWVDVRDIALAHVLALTKDEAGGERLLISKGEFTWQDFIDAANSLPPSALPLDKLPKGNPGAGKSCQHKILYDARKAERILGLGAEVKYHTMEETSKDSLEDFARRGWF